MNGTGIAGLFVILSSLLVSFLILTAVIRYSIDSSRTAKEIKDLVYELQMLRKEIKASKHIIDRKL